MIWGESLSLFLFPMWPCWLSLPFLIWMVKLSDLFGFWRTGSWTWQIQGHSVIYAVHTKVIFVSVIVISCHNTHLKSWWMGRKSEAMCRWPLTCTDSEPLVPLVHDTIITTPGCRKTLLTLAMSVWSKTFTISCEWLWLDVFLDGWITHRREETLPSGKQYGIIKSLPIP